MDNKRGYYIVVEGLEGAGKSTAMKTIRSFLSEKVAELVLTRGPGGTEVGEKARELMLATDHQEPLDPKAELLLLYAARIQLCELVINPALKRGAWVLADRNELSSFAYQGGGRKLNKGFIEALSSFGLGGLKPDLLLFLDIRPQRGLNRVSMRGKMDRIESESLSFFTDVYESYHEQLKKMENAVIIDAEKPLKSVQNSIRAELDTFLACHAID